jgi:hypothetical protein
MARAWPSHIRTMEDWMSLRFRAVLLSLSFAAVALGQTQPEPRAPFGEIIANSGKREEPVSQAKDDSVPQSVMRRTDPPVESQSVYDGTSGDIIMANAPAPYGTAGIFLRANTTAVPSIAARLGDSTTTSYFTVADAGNNVLFRARAGDGRFGIGELNPAHMLHVTKAQNAATGMQITNSSTGTASATTVAFSESGTVKAEISSLGSGSSRAAGPNALEIRNEANAPIAFFTNATEAMRLLSNGSLNVGTSAYPNAKVAIVEPRFGTGVPLYVAHSTSVPVTSGDNDFGIYLSSQQNVAAGVVNNAGIISLHNEAYNIGAGKIKTITSEWIKGGISGSSTAATVDTAIGSKISIFDGAGAVGLGYGLYIDNIEATKGWGVYQLDPSDVNYFGGNVGIGVTEPTYKLQVAGNAHFQGVVTGTEIRATYQDLAEWVPAAEDLAPGTVVVLNPDAVNQVRASSKPYDTLVAGVVSAQPGLLLGVAGDEKEQVANTGRVKVRVDATKSPIRVGDLLVTSDKPGTAMRSEPTEINGRSFHQPGTIIGKALEPLASGAGEILVLLSMQ